jgi:cytochrome c oxidase subunit 2
VGSRFSIGAGILTNELRALGHWLSHPGHIKPGVHMPAFGMLPQEEREAIAAYLKELK